MLIPPNRQRPERKVGIALHRSSYETIGLAELRDGPVRVENEERMKAEGTQSEARDAHEADDRLGRLHGHSVTTSLVAETPRR